MPFHPEQLVYDADESLTVILQEHQSGVVLRLGTVDRIALQRSLTSGVPHLNSGASDVPWTQPGVRLIGVRVSVDGKALVFLCAGVHDAGGANRFRETLHGVPTGETLGEAATALFDTIRRRQASGDPSTSYVARLMAGGVDRVARKVGEEATEVVIAAKNADRAELARETADLWFHSYLLLAQQEVRPDEVWAVLRERRGQQEPPIESDSLAHEGKPGAA